MKTILTIIFQAVLSSFGTVLLFIVLRLLNLLLKFKWLDKLASAKTWFILTVIFAVIIAIGRFRTIN